MSPSVISSLIAEAKLHEARTGQLQELFRVNLSRLHHSIHLPKHEPERHLLEIVEQYVDAIPEFLNVMMHKSYSGIMARSYQPLVTVIRSFFLQPVNHGIEERVDERLGMDCLMHQAFMAHRFLEEINDKYIVKVGLPILETRHMSTTLIIHDLIGDEFANFLDQSVCDLIALMESEGMLAMPRNQVSDSEVAIAG